MTEQTTEQMTEQTTEQTTEQMTEQITNLAGWAGWQLAGASCFLAAGYWLLPCLLAAGCLAAGLSSLTS